MLLDVFFSFDLTNLKCLFLIWLFLNIIWNCVFWAVKMSKLVKVFPLAKLLRALDQLERLSAIFWQVEGGGGGGGGGVGGQQFVTSYLLSCTQIPFWREIHSKRKEFYSQRETTFVTFCLICSTQLHIQSNFVISTFSNDRLSRSENLVPALTWQSNNR